MVGKFAADDLHLVCLPEDTSKGAAHVRCDQSLPCAAATANFPYGLGVDPPELGGCAEDDEAHYPRCDSRDEAQDAADGA